MSPSQRCASPSLRETLREEMGGVYTVSVSGRSRGAPHGNNTAQRELRLRAGERRQARESGADEAARLQEKGADATPSHRACEIKRRTRETPPRRRRGG